MYPHTLNLFRLETRFVGMDDPSFNSFSIISAQWVGDNERVCAMASCLPMENILISGGP